MKLNKILFPMMLMGVSSMAMAKASMQEVSKLGAELTPMGAQVSGNAQGSIPSYQGGLPQDKQAKFLEDIYAQEKPLFTISGENLAQYKDKLSDGQIAMFDKYPDSYRMPVYATHRTANFPQHIYDTAKKNAASTELSAGGNGLLNFSDAVPFAIPKNGLEAVWNHIARFRGGSVEVNTAQIAIEANGSFTPVKIRGQLTSPNYLVDPYSEEKDNNILFYYTQYVKAPARFTGNIFLVQETIDQVKQARKAWVYNAGQRRVRRAPQIAYDAPTTTGSGLRTSDQVDMYNGAPNKYNWKLVGKQEMYIPYNAYKMVDANVPYEDMVKPNHVNQDFTRYELHRVWKVEGTLKEGERHIYAKRTFYIDEDSWQVSVADHYDNRGKLWRVSEGHPLQFVGVNTPWYVGTTNYDLFSNKYVVDLFGRETNPFVFGTQVKRKSFTASAIRRMGKR